MKKLRLRDTKDVPRTQSYGVARHPQLPRKETQLVPTNSQDRGSTHRRDDVCSLRLPTDQAEVTGSVSYSLIKASKQP